MDNVKISQIYFIWLHPLDELVWNYPLVKVKAKGLGVFFETGLVLLNIGIINHEKK